MFVDGPEDGRARPHDVRSRLTVSGLSPESPSRW
jgi:hypothetical protein